MRKVLIVYASWTGNSKEIAHILAENFKGLGLKVCVRECQQIDAKAFKSVDICVVATYTYGSAGDLPDEIVGFYEDLGALDLSGKVYGVLGSGEEFYGYYCKSVDDFDQQFQLTGATRGAEVLKIELNAKEADKKRIERFAQSLVKTDEK